MRFVKTIGAAALMSIMAVGATFADSDDDNDRHVRIINETGHTMVSFYASNVSENDWGEDILGQDTLEPGQDVMINIDDDTGHCKFDFKAVFQDNAKMQPIELERDGIDVCQVNFYRYSE